MMDPNLLIAIGGLVVAPVAAFIAATKRLSGKISTSDAGELWSESASIREDYRDRLVKADARQALLEDRVSQLQAVNEKLYRENLSLRQRLGILDATTDQQPKS